MKTYKQMLHELAPLTEQIKMVYSFYTHERAAKAYAEQAIDRCAETAKTGGSEPGNTAMSCTIIDKSSILKVKYELK